MTLPEQTLIALGKRSMRFRRLAAELLLACELRGCSKRMKSHWDMAAGTLGRTAMALPHMPRPHASLVPLRIRKPLTAVTLLEVADDVEAAVLEQMYGIVNRQILHAAADSLRKVARRMMPKPYDGPVETEPYRRWSEAKRLRDQILQRSRRSSSGKTRRSRR